MIHCENSVAASNKFDTWSSINWKEVEEFVRNMQIKIADAAKKEKWREINRLQYTLTHSFRAKLLAVRIVTSSTGNRTAGVDGQIWKHDETKLSEARNLDRKTYKPSPLKRVIIPKPNGGERALGIPTMRDRAMQCLYKFALEPVAEVFADQCSYGFRKHRCCQDALEHIVGIFQGTKGAEWVLEGDIEKCFDKISHEWLLSNIQMDKNLLEKWLKAGFVFQDTLFLTEEGTPQGGVISPILANLALDGLEKLLKDRFPRHHGKKVNLVRYADDFIISGVSKEVMENEVKPLVEEFLSVRGLKLSDSKTSITHIDDGFDFLGFTVRKFKGKLITKPSKKSIKKFLKTIKEFLTDHRTSKQTDIIIPLNKKISGWSNYFKHCSAKVTFSYIDFRIWKMIWQWCKRRHPNKNNNWVKAKYFITFKGRDWRFSADEHYLTIAASFPITRWIKLRKDAEVFNPAWDEYFELREA
jgi:RNA-directed DNA polymerase